MFKKIYIGVDSVILLHTSKTLNMIKVFIKEKNIK